MQIRVSLTSALAGNEWSASRSGHFNPGETVPSTTWIGWAGPRTGLGNTEQINMTFTNQHL
jgi:hypothetical protein